jgi:filamentous hemagglutinin
VNNHGARIEALGNLRIDAAAINNTNSNFATELRSVLTDTVAWNNVPGTSTWLSDSQVLFREAGDGCGGHNIVPSFSQMGDEDCFKLHVYTGDAVQKAVYGPTPRGPVYVAEQDNRYCDSNGNCGGSIVAEQFVLGRGDVLWAAAGVVAPSDTPAPRYVTPSGYEAVCPGPDWAADVPACDAASRDYQDRYDPWIAEQRAAYIALQAKVDAYNALWRIYGEWTHIDGVRSVQETVVVQSQAGQILAGGNMTLGGAVVNDRSRIVAGGALVMNGPAVDNRGASGERITTIAGRAIRTTIESHTFQPDDRQYSRTDYDDTQREALTDVGVMPHQGFASPGIDGSNAAAARALATAPAAARTAATAITALSRGGSVTAAPTTRVNVTPASGAGTISTFMPAMTLPTSSLFNVGNAPGRGYLVETDPRFTNYRVWASSEVLLAQLNADPQTTLRRLGDGYYEQRLVTEQIMAATGQRYVGDYRDGEAQYLALLNAGAEFAQTHALTLGVALSEAQMRLLTTDMVWLVAQNVTLPDGTVERVLVPQVYVRVAEGDLRADGTLMAGSQVRMQLQGDLTNSGTILGRQISDIRAENIGNSGRIGSAGLTALTAPQDIASSGAIDGKVVLVEAERDVTLTTQTSTSTGKNASRTSADRVATINAGQLLQVSAGRDITLAGAQVSSGGALVLDAARDLNLATVNVAESIDIAWDARNRLATGNTAELGSTIKAAGDITLTAGQDINARAAYVTSQSGAIDAAAGRDIAITAGQATSRFSEDRHVENNSNGFGPKGSLLARETDSRRSTATHSQGNSTQVQGSTFSAERIAMTAGRDLTVQGSNVAATNDVSLSAARDLTLASAEQTNSTSQSRDVQRSGFGAMGGISNGSKNVNQANTQTNTTQVGSSVGSLQGNVTLAAGNDYRQTASDVRALQGDIAISGANVRIDTADNTSSATQDLRMRQSGASLTFSSPIVSALQSMAGTMDAAGQSQDSRTQALAAASTAMAAYNLASTVTQASALNINLSVGNSRSQSHSGQSGSMAATSTVQAGGDLTIKATGKEPGQGNLTAIGANLNAGNNATLSATNDIDLRAAQNSATQTSTNRSSSASVGIGFALGGTQNGFTINAAASQSRGNADGRDVTNTLTTVTAGNALTLTSGRDTNLIGAVASGNQVTANVGGNLDIQSVQDTSTYTSRQNSAGVGVSICVYPICYGTSSASVSASNSRVNGEFASVTTQSGIKAGDGGFQVNVGGNTNLAGAAITSSQAAVDAGKNSLATNTITQSEIGNRDRYNANSIAVSASYSSARTEYNPDTDQAQTARNADGALSQASTGQSIGVGSASGSQRSTTGNAISGATVTIKSGDSSALDGIDRAAVTTTNSANGLTRNWDGQALAQNVTLQAQITQTLSQAAPRAVADFAQGRINNLTEQARVASEAGDKARAQELRDEASRWNEGGAYRVAMHTGVGALNRTGILEAHWCESGVTSEMVYTRFTACRKLPDTPRRRKRTQVMACSIWLR